MTKISFELEVEEIVENAEIGNINTEIFKGEENSGKIYLLIDKFTKMMQVAICVKASTEENKYAQVDWFPLPKNTKVIEGGNEYDEHKELMNKVQFCCDELNNKLKENYNDMATFIGQELDAIKKEGVGGNVISESTLLKALEIVTNNKK